MHRLLPLPACLLAAASALAAEAPLVSLRTDAPPVIDGVLDDAVWAMAPSVTEFRTFHPDFGQRPDDQTVAWVAHDAERLYFAYRCYDAEPGRIKTSVTARDNMGNDDWVCLNLDTFGDRQALYALYVNPNGIQGDARFSGGVEDWSVDFVWTSAGRVDDEGYAVEIAIPLGSLRYAAGDPTRMTVFFERKVSRRGEHVAWPEFDPELGMNLTMQMAPVEFAGLRAQRLVEVLPAITHGRSYGRDRGDLELADETTELSLTAKVGLTSDLTLDATVNPDFSQVEADAGQVDINLRSPLFFTEKRPFFLEGSDHFRVVGTAVSEVDPLRTIVHTRTIADPIAGVKLVGKTGERSTIALLYAADERPGGGEDHVPIVRFKRAFGNDGFIGGVFAGRETDDGYNRVAGLDGIVRTSGANTLHYQALASDTERSGGSALGHALAARLSHQSRSLDWTLSVRDLDESFAVDTGYLARTGVRQYAGLVKPKLFPGQGPVQRIDLEAFSAQTEDLPSDQWETFNHVSALALVGGSGQVKVKWSRSTEIFAGRTFDTGGFHVFASAQFTRRLFAGVLYRDVDAILYDPAAPQQGRSHRLTADLILQPTDHLELYLNHVRFDFERDGVEVYDYPITYGRLTWQLSRTLFLRGIVEYNEYHDELTTDLLASFTWIPGTVVHAGYGSLYDKLAWDGEGYAPTDDFREAVRGVFLKASYLWRV